MVKCLNLFSFQAHGLVLDAPAGAESKKVGCEVTCTCTSVHIYMYTWRLHSFLLAQAGDAALIRNYVFLKTFVAASIAPDMGIPNLGDFKAHSAEFN